MGTSNSSSLKERQWCQPSVLHGAWKDDTGTRTKVRWPCQVYLTATSTHITDLNWTQAARTLQPSLDVGLRTQRQTTCTYVPWLAYYLSVTPEYIVIGGLVPRVGLSVGMESEKVCSCGKAHWTTTVEDHIGRDCAVLTCQRSLLALET